LRDSGASAIVILENPLLMYCRKWSIDKAKHVRWLRMYDPAGQSMRPLGSTFAVRHLRRWS
jgi:hypothetical protein